MINCELHLLQEDTACVKMSTDTEKREWSTTDMVKLIAIYQTMPELWNQSCPNYKEKSMKVAAFNKLSETFNTSIGELRRKVHNLRCQFTTELRRLKYKALRLNAHPSEVRSDWKYFESLSYLLVNYKDFQKDGVYYNNDKINYAENADETSNSMEYSRQFSQSDEDKSDSGNCRPSTSTPRRIVPKSEEVYINEGDFQITKKRKVSDEDHRIFGEYVASELRNMSERSAQILKMKIRKAILEVTEEEFNMDNGASEYLEFNV